MRAPTGETLRQASDAWLEGARAGLIRPRSGEPYKPSAIRNYDQHLRLRVLPELGSRKLSEITRTSLQDFVDGLVAAGESGAVIEGALSPVRAIYRRACGRPDSGISVNPTVGLELPAAGGRRDRIAPPKEAAALLKALTKDRALWATCLYAGLRRGEAMALRVKDIDLGAGTIHVQRGWDRYEGVIATKSGKDRKVPIPGALRRYLAEHLLGLGWSDDGLVFGISASSPFVVHNVIARADKAWEDAKVQRITMHECRHTYASLMIAAGVNAKALSVYMGHANIGITLDRYGHLFPGNESEAAGLLDAYLDREAS
jgi:integrase